VYWCGAQGEGTAVTTLQLAGTAATATAGDADADAMTVSDDVSETCQAHVVLGSALGPLFRKCLILLDKVISTCLHVPNFFCVAKRMQAKRMQANSQEHDAGSAT
jgi:hypothetical protein